MKNNLKIRKKNLKKFRIEKVLKIEKVINCISNGKNTTIHLIVALIKKTLNYIPSNAISLYKNESILS